MAYLWGYCCRRTGNRTIPVQSLTNEVILCVVLSVVAVFVELQGVAIGNADWNLTFWENVKCDVFGRRSAHSHDYLSHPDNSLHNLVTELLPGCSCWFPVAVFLRHTDDPCVINSRSAFCNFLWVRVRHLAA